MFSPQCSIVSTQKNHMKLAKKKEKTIRNLEILLKLSLSTLTPVLTSSSFTLSLHIYYYKNHMKLAKKYFLLLKNHQYVSCLKDSAKIFYKRIILLL
ncbi:Hypothetical predicted protein [Octopus vulgaris]|uniref:Uncharacterized protein n=1 Tax=Octopus vulgaris TaxID=6645 RepID=A0AA36BWH8_OCTVU|nr:Hypothetical predicted protein [Octopus vulgaris]